MMIQPLQNTETASMTLFALLLNSLINETRLEEMKINNNDILIENKEIKTLKIEAEEVDEIKC